MNTNKPFPNLPEYDPHPNLWARIEADLDSDATLARVVAELPEYEPRADLWDDVPANGIPDFSPAFSPPSRILIWDTVRPLWSGLAVAAVVVLVGVWLFLRVGDGESVRVEYAVEAGRSIPVSETDSALNDVPSGADQRAEAFIRQQCAEQALACQRPEVHELRNQLTDLTAEQNRITNERRTFGDDPRLVRAQVQIENQRADVTKELITLLRS